MELLKQTSWSKTSVRLFHDRALSGQRVDDVLEDAAGRLVGVEVKASRSVSSGDFAGLRSLRGAVAERLVRGVVLYDGSEQVGFEKGLEAVPMSSL